MGLVDSVLSKQEFVLLMCAVLTDVLDNLLSIEWDSIRLSGPADGIVTKTVHKTLPGGWWGQGGGGEGRGQGVVGVGIHRNISFQI